MALLNWFGMLFRRVGALVREALGSAVVRGLTDDIISLAMVYARLAATKYVDNTEKREYAVQGLIKKGIPESLARLAVEMAVQLIKQEVERMKG